MGPFTRLFSALAALGLAILLTGGFAWGVIGKHRLDRDARLVYKSTRAVCVEARELPGELPQGLEARSPLCDDAGTFVERSSLSSPPSDVAAASPSRSPPLS